MAQTPLQAETLLAALSKHPRGQSHSCCGHSELNLILQSQHHRRTLAPDFFSPSCVLDNKSIKWYHPYSQALGKTLTACVGGLETNEGRSWVRRRHEGQKEKVGSWQIEVCCCCQTGYRGRKWDLQVLSHFQTLIECCYYKSQNGRTHKQC